MNDCLMIMNCREISVCLSSISKLPIDKAYFTGYTEAELESAIDSFIKETDYENYLLVSDDVICDSESLNKIRDGLALFEVATGYCNISPDSPYVNLTEVPLTNLPMDTSNYHFMTLRDINKQTTYFPTYFMGFSPSGMRRYMWLKHPFKSYHAQNYSVVGDSYSAELLMEHVKPTRVIGYASDFYMSKQLQDNNILIAAVKGAYSEHLGGNLLLQPTLIGKTNPEVKLVKYHESG